MARLPLPLTMSCLTSVEGGWPVGSGTVGFVERSLLSGGAVGVSVAGGVAVGGGGAWGGVGAGLAWPRSLGRCRRRRTRRAGRARGRGGPERGACDASQ